MVDHVAELIRASYREGGCHRHCTGEQVCKRPQADDVGCCGDSLDVIVVFGREWHVLPPPPCSARGTRPQGDESACLRAEDVSLDLSEDVPCGRVYRGAWKGWLHSLDGDSLIVCVFAEQGDDCWSVELHQRFCHVRVRRWLVSLLQLNQVEYHQSRLAQVLSPDRDLIGVVKGHSASELLMWWIEANEFHSMC